MKPRTTPIKRIIIHCSDYERPHGIEQVTKWHKLRGFDTIGYHFFIKKDGTIQTGRELKYIGSHAKGANFDSIGICLEGQKQFTGEQIDSLCRYVNYLMIEHRVSLDNVIGHCEVNSGKTCPNIPPVVLRKLVMYYALATK